VSAEADKWVRLGRVSGVYGVKGWLKVFSDTEPRQNIIDFSTWRLRRTGPSGQRTELDRRVESGRLHGKQVIAKLEAVDDRDQAEALIGAEILVRRSALPPCKDGTYYWVDLIGLTVRNTSGVVLGTVDHMLETGGHDVMVLDEDKTRMIPFVMNDVVRDVDLVEGVITVDWQPGYWEE
jgi:16S rRNA processing protein RimM